MATQVPELDLKAFSSSGDWDIRKDSNIPNLKAGSSEWEQYIKNAADLTTKLKRGQAEIKDAPVNIQEDVKSWNPAADPVYKAMVEVGSSSQEITEYTRKRANIADGKISTEDWNSYIESKVNDLNTRLAEKQKQEELSTAVEKAKGTEWKPIMSSSGERVIGYEYDPTGGEVAAMYNAYASGQITKQQWLDYVNRQKEITVEVKKVVPTPAAPSLSAIVSEQKALQEATAGRKLSTGEIVSEQQFEKLPVKLQKELIQTGITGYNETIAKTQELASKTPIDEGAYNKMLSNSTSPLAGHLEHVFTAQQHTEAGIGMTVEEIKAQYRPIKGIPLSEYIQKKAELARQGKTELQIEIEMSDYYPTMTATEYGQTNLDVGGLGVVIKETGWEKFTPWKEQEGYIPSSTDLFTLGAGLVLPGIATWQRRKDMDATELGISIAVDALMIVPFVGTAARGARSVGSNILRVVENAFGKEGANIALTYTERMATAVEARSATQLAGAADDMMRFATAAKESGVQGMDELIENARIVKENPVVFLNSTDKVPQNLDDIFKMAYGKVEKINAITTGKPLGADALTTVVLEERGGVNTATVPITRAEANQFGLRTGDIERIYNNVGNNREAFLKAADATRLTRLDNLMTDVNNYLGRESIRTGVPEYEVFSEPVGSGVPYPGVEWGLGGAVTSYFEDVARETETVISSLKPIASGKNVNTIFNTVGSLGKQAPIGIGTGSVMAVYGGIVLRPSINLNPDEWRPMLANELSQETYSKIQQELSVLPASKQIEYLTVANLLDYALAYDTEYILRELIQSGEAIQQIAIDTVPKTAQEILTSAMNQVFPEAGTVAKIQEIMKEEVQTEPAIETKIATEPALQTEVKVATITETPTVTEVRPVEKEEFIKPAIVEGRGSTKPIPVPILSFPEMQFNNLTPKQKKGAVAWLQGIMYKCVYPPYGQENIINSRKPFPGMKIHPNARKAFETLTQIVEGPLPSTITRDMGIMDITIRTSGGKSTISYVEDKYQRTTTGKRKSNSAPRIVNTRRTE